MRVRWIYRRKWISFSFRGPGVFIRYKINEFPQYKDHPSFPIRKYRNDFRFRQRKSRERLHLHGHCNQWSSRSLQHCDSEPGWKCLSFSRTKGCQWRKFDDPVGGILAYSMALLKDRSRCGKASSTSRIPSGISHPSALRS